LRLSLALLASVVRFSQSTIGARVSEKAFFD